MCFLASDYAEGLVFLFILSVPVCLGLASCLFTASLPQRMPYDGGFSHLCSTASDTATAYVCSSPPAEPFQGKAASAGNERRPGSCNRHCSSTQQFPGDGWHCPWAGRASARPGNTLRGAAYRQRAVLLVELHLGAPSCQRRGRGREDKNQHFQRGGWFGFFPAREVVVSRAGDTNTAVPLTK